jgi:MFS family permease
MIRHRGVLTGSSYLSMFFLGVGTAVIGAASGSIGHTPYQTGLLISVQNVGFIVSVLASGSLADSSDKARLM